MIIVLCGYMGSGKSLIGRNLAKEIAVDFLDLDDEITKEKQRSIPQIFKEKGEIDFRKIEAKILYKNLQRKTNTVLALGGGTPCYGQNLKLIKENPNATLVYLKVSLDVLTKRLYAERKHRPLIKDIDAIDRLKDYIRKHLFERQYYYMQSDFVVDCSADSPEEIVSKLKRRLLQEKVL